MSWAIFPFWIPCQWLIVIAGCYKKLRTNVTLSSAGLSENQVYGVYGVYGPGITHNRTSSSRPLYTAGSVYRHWGFKGDKSDCLQLYCQHIHSDDRDEFHIKFKCPPPPPRSLSQRHWFVQKSLKVEVRLLWELVQTNWDRIIFGCHPMAGQTLPQQI